MILSQEYEDETEDEEEEEMCNNWFQNDNSQSTGEFIVLLLVM